MNLFQIADTERVQQLSIVEAAADEYDSINPGFDSRNYYHANLFQAAAAAAAAHQTALQLGYEPKPNPAPWLFLSIFY